MLDRDAGRVPQPIWQHSDKTVRRRHNDKQAGETTLPLVLPVNSTINVVYRIVKQIGAQHARASSTLLRSVVLLAFGGS